MNLGKKIPLYFTTTQEGMQVIYHTCPYCEANLDPGERCDCPRAKEEYAPKPRKRASTYPGGYDYQMKEAHRYDHSCP